MNYLSYMKYIIRHKYFVFVASVALKVSLIQCLFHDFSKFTPSEWFPYMNCFYKKDGAKRYNETQEFAKAWNSHQKRNKHHYQYWLLTWDNGKTEALEMEECYVREMVADWFGAGKAITGKWDAKNWYHANKHKMTLHDNTALRVEELLEGCKL